MKIHILSNSPRLNSGFSIVAKNLAIGLRKLGHEVTYTGMQTAYVPEFSSGIEVLPAQTLHVDDTTQCVLTINRIKPDVVLAIFQMDYESNDFAKIFPKTVCLLPDSPILTLDRGVQKIKDIKIGDKVLTHKGRFMRVNEVMKREYYGDMIKIASHKLKIPIVMTPEHKVLAIKTSMCIGDSGVVSCRPDAKCYRNISGYQNKRCKYIYGEEPWRKYKTQWIDAKDLRIGDWVVHPKTNEKVVDIEKIRIIDYIDDILNITGEVHEDKSQQTDLFGTFIDKTVCSKFDPGKSIPAEIVINKDFMRLCGYFIAEGGINYDYAEDRNTGIYFAFNINEKEYISDVKKIMKSIFGLESLDIDERNYGIDAINLQYCNKILADLFENLFSSRDYQTKKGRGKKSNIVRIPSEFLNLPSDKLREMVKGIWRGDGTYYKSSENCKKNNYEYSISTTSETLALQLTYIMSRFNILCSINLKYPKKENHAMAYDVSILGEDIDIFENIINERNLNRESYKQVNKYIRGNKFFYLPIIDIGIINHSGDVWNLEVEGDNSYISTISVHNCYTPVEGRNIPQKMANDLLQIKMNGGQPVAQCKYGQGEMQSALGGIEVPYIYHGFDDKIFYPIEKDKLGKVRYCYYCTETGQNNSDPWLLHTYGCFDCFAGSGRLKGKYKENCPHFKEEEVTILKFINGKWTEVDMPITQLPTITKGKFVFGFVGQNLGVRKRIERLLKAYSMFIKDSRQLKDRSLLHLHCLPIAINGINLIKIIQDIGIQDNVIFSYGTYRSSAWTYEAMSVLYNTFDINMSASSSEGFGLPTLESMACGKPNIAPSCSSFVELIGDGEKDPSNSRGLLALIGEWQMIENGSERALVNEDHLSVMMKKMYQNEDLRNTFSKNAIKFAQDYTWEKIVKQWDELLKKM